jgi:hypothetical protein
MIRKASFSDCCWHRHTTCLACSHLRVAVSNHFSSLLCHGVLCIGDVTCCDVLCCAPLPAGVRQKRPRQQQPLCSPAVLGQCPL